MAKEIIIDIDDEGAVEVHTHGFKSGGTGRTVARDAIQIDFVDLLGL